MKYTLKQKLHMAYHGVDGDELENPKQKLPPVEQRLAKIERYLSEGKGNTKDYLEKRKIYQTLLHPEQSKMRGIWNSLWGA